MPSVFTVEPGCAKRFAAIKAEFDSGIREMRPRGGAGLVLMENVEAAPKPLNTGYWTWDQIINNRWCGGIQNRRRRFTFGVEPFKAAPLSLPIDFETFMPAEYAPCVTANGTQWEPFVANGGRSRSDRSVKALANYVRWQGLPADFLDDAPFTVEGKVRVVGNGVPLPMGRAVARAVKQAMDYRFDGDEREPAEVIPPGVQTDRGGLLIEDQG